MTKKIIKLINNEHSKRRNTPAKACDSTSIDTGCTMGDYAHCYVHSTDSCNKDLTACINYSTDYCTSYSGDVDACYNHQIDID